MDQKQRPRRTNAERDKITQSPIMLQQWHQKTQITPPFFNYYKQFITQKAINQ